MHYLSKDLLRVRKQSQLNKVVSKPDMAERWLERLEEEIGALKQEISKEILEAMKVAKELLMQQMAELVHTFSIHSEVGARGGGETSSTVR